MTSRDLKGQTTWPQYV